MAEEGIGETGKDGGSLGGILGKKIRCKVCPIFVLPDGQEFIRRHLGGCFCEAVRNPNRVNHPNARCTRKVGGVVGKSTESLFIKEDGLLSWLCVRKNVGESCAAMCFILHHGENICRCKPVVNVFNEWPRKSIERIDRKACIRNNDGHLKKIGGKSCGRCGDFFVGMRLNFRAIDISSLKNDGREVGKGFLGQGELVIVSCNETKGLRHMGSSIGENPRRGEGVDRVQEKREKERGIFCPKRDFFIEKIQGNREIDGERERRKGKKRNPSTFYAPLLA